jgi:uncharacterized protein YjbI with pentapeptide repeats
LNVTDATIVAADDNAPDSSAQPANGHPRQGFLKFLLVCGLLTTLAILTANVVLLTRQLEQTRSRNREHLFYVVCDDQSSADERASAFLKLVRIGQSEWRSALLNKTDLRGANVPNASLHFIALTDADLRKANFSKCDMHGANLALSDVSNANLGEVILTEGNLFKTIFNKTDLRSANLSGASLSQATVHEANLVLADLTECDLLMTDLTESNLAGANLTGANLEAAVLTGCNLALARLDGAILVDTDFTDSNWWRARGLRGDQQLELVARYSPSSKDPDRLRDFELWLNSKDEDMTDE